MQLSAFSSPTDELSERHSLIALSLVPGIGPGRIRALVGHLGSARAVLTAAPGVLSRIPGIGRHSADAVRTFDRHSLVESQLERAEQVEARLVTAWDEAFPVLLREIYDPPAFLWVRGQLNEEDRRAIAIVGTRKATDYGRRVAQDFAAELARRGFTIISGLAHGIDAAAHRGALDAGGRTIAVLGSGVDVVYPARNTPLARQIIEQGAVISEYPLGAKPDAPNFPRRNRIVSGMSLGTVVVEAHASGGALITARLAVEQNRDVFVVPGSIFNPAVEGGHDLIKRGYGKLVTNVDDILEEFYTGTVEPVAGVSKNAPGPAVELNEIESRLYDSLDSEPVHLDNLCLKTDIDSSTALVYLLSLEFKGLVRQMAGKQFYRV